MCSFRGSSPIMARNICNCSIAARYWALCKRPTLGVFIVESPKFGPIIASDPSHFQPRNRIRSYLVWILPNSNFHHQSSDFLSSPDFSRFLFEALCKLRILFSSSLRQIRQESLKESSSGFFGFLSENGWCYSRAWKGRIDDILFLLKKGWDLGEKWHVAAILKHVDQEEALIRGTLANRSIEKAAESVQEESAI